MISPLQLKPDDRLPFKICSLCVARCDAAYNFREMCEKSDQELRASEIKISPVPSALQSAARKRPYASIQKEPMITEVLVPEAVEDPDPLINVDPNEHIITEIIIGSGTETEIPEEDSQPANLKEEVESMEEHDYSIVSYEQVSEVKYHPWSLNLFPELINFCLLSRKPNVSSAMKVSWGKLPCWTITRMPIRTRLIIAQIANRSSINSTTGDLIYVADRYGRNK